MNGSKCTKMTGGLLSPALSTWGMYCEQDFTQTARHQSISRWYAPVRKIGTGRSTQPFTLPKHNGQWAIGHAQLRSQIVRLPTYYYYLLHETDYFTVVMDRAKIRVIPR